MSSASAKGSLDNNALVELRREMYLSRKHETVKARKEENRYCIGNVILSEVEGSALNHT